MGQVAVPLPSQPQADPRRWWIAGFALIGVLIIVGGALIATKIFAATRSTFADSMPPDSAAFFHIDLLNVVRSDEMDRTIAAFEAENEEGELIEDVMNEIDRLLLAEGAQFDFSNDIVPWMGRGVGVSILTFGGFEVDPEFLVAIDVRDSGEFAKFFPKLLSTIEELDGPMGEEDYQGVTIYTGSDGALAMSKAVLLMGSNGDTVKDAIDAQSKTSLADLDEFVATIELLPDDRVLTGWVDMAQYADEFIDAYGLSTTDDGFYEAFVNPEQAPASYGFSGKFVESGIRFDFAALYPETSNTLDAWRDVQLKTAGLAPSNTLGFFAAPPLVDTYLNSIREGFVEEFEDVRRQGIEEYGIDIDTDFLSVLNGEFGLLVAWEPGGWMDRQWEIPVGLAAYLGTSDEDRLRNTLARFIDIEGDLGFEIVGPYGDPELYDAIDDYDDTTIPFGVDYGFLMASSDRSLLENVFATEGGRLADEAAFQRAAAELDGLEYLFFVDFGKIDDLIKSLDPGDTSEFPGPLQTVLAGYQIDGNVFSGAALISIDY